MLESFIEKFTPEIAAHARAALAKLRKQLKGAVVLVYDNYNALAIGFGPNETVKDSIFSVAVFPRAVSFFFLQGRKLLDPQKLLRGTGSRVGHIKLSSTKDLDQPAVKALMEAALDQAAVPLNTKAKGYVVVKSISAKQRPRRPMAIT